LGKGKKVTAEKKRVPRGIRGKKGGGGVSSVQDMGTPKKKGLAEKKW